MHVQTASNAALPPARPAAPEPAAGGDGAFAQLLARQPEVDAGSRSDLAASTDGATRPDEARAARLRQAGARTPSAKAPGTEAKSAGPREATKDGVKDRAEVGDDQDDVTQSDAAPVDPALAQWLAQWPRPQAEAEPAAPGHLPGHAQGAGTGRLEASTSEAGSDVGAALQSADGRSASGAHAAAGPRHGRPADDAERAATAGTPETPVRGADEAVGTAAAAPRAVNESSFVLPTTPEPAASAAAGAPATSATTAAPAEAPVSAAVPVPVDSADFAEAFGVQVSVLARDGVQQAELHLNPAEMGPVSVQIVMDGERARIDFGAQAAATRAAIEASLPELAAALRDAGLTLAGGGVSQQTAGRGDDSRQGSSDQPSGRAGRTAAAESGGARPTWRGRVSASGVDLYA